MITYIKQDFSDVYCYCYHKSEANIPGDPKRTWARLSRVLQHVHGHRVLPYYQLGRGRQYVSSFFKYTMYIHIDTTFSYQFLI